MKHIKTFLLWGIVVLVGLCLVLLALVLLVAFPLAHGVILQALYLPVALMLLGLILRGVAFDFRVKARAEHKAAWNRAFYAGSLIATLAQGYMLGLLIMI